MDGTGSSSRPCPGSDPSLILAAATTSAKSSFGSWSVSVTTCNRWFKNRAKATRPEHKRIFYGRFLCRVASTLKVLLMDNKKPDQIIVKQGSKMCPLYSCYTISAPLRAWYSTHIAPQRPLSDKKVKNCHWKDKKVGWNHLLSLESFTNTFL